MKTPDTTMNMNELDPKYYYDIFTTDTEALILPLVLKNELEVILPIVKRGLNNLQEIEFKKSMAFISGYDTYITTDMA